jgi:hypothetical protein
MPKRTKCRSGKTGVFTTASAAGRALERIEARLRAGIGTDHPYFPTGYYKCRSGGFPHFHLSSKPVKPWKHGKGANRSGSFR